MTSLVLSSYRLRKLDQVFTERWVIESAESVLLACDRSFPNAFTMKSLRWSRDG